MSKYHGPRIAKVGLREQRARMNAIHPQFHCVLAKPRGVTTLICRGDVQPTPINGVYRTRIEYAIPSWPTVWIESPELEKRNPDEQIPHTFDDGSVCLFKHDFQADMHLAMTVVPWLMMWLMFYEAWHVTGEWQGGGIHPTSLDDGHDRAA